MRQWKRFFFPISSYQKHHKIYSAIHFRLCSFLLTMTNKLPFFPSRRSGVKKQFCNCVWKMVASVNRDVKIIFLLDKVVIREKKKRQNQKQTKKSQTWVFPRMFSIRTARMKESKNATEWKNKNKKETLYLKKPFLQKFKFNNNFSVHYCLFRRLRRTTVQKSLKPFAIISAERKTNARINSTSWS